MNHHVYAVVAGLVLSLAVLAPSAALAAEPVVVVDAAALVEQSTPGKAAASYLQKVQASLQKSLDELQALYKGKENTPEARQAVAEGRAVLERQLALYRQAAGVELDRVIAEAVKAWRGKNRKTLVVLPARDVLDYDKGVDVTREVLRELNRQTAKFPDLPQVTVQKPKK